MVFNPLSLPLVGSGIILLVIAVLAWRFPTTPGAKVFSLLSLSSAVYCLGYAGEISSASLPDVLFWLKVEYLGISVLPAFYILFALGYTGKDKVLTPPLLFALFIIPVITLTLFYTNEYHQLYYQAVQMNTQGPFPVISFGRGSWYWVHIFYIGFAAVAGSMLFLMMWFNTGPIYRNRLCLMLIGSLVPWAAHLLYQTAPGPWKLDLTPFSFTFTGILFFWGLLRYQLLDLTPIARTTLFEETPDGVLVLDKRGQIVDYNPSATKYLGIGPDHIGLGVDDVFGVWLECNGTAASGVGFQDPPPANTVEVAQDLEGTKRHFELEFLPLRDGHENPRGRLVLIRDITQRKHQEEQLRLLSLHDHLTGLYNRAYFEAEMQRLAGGKYPITIISADLDDLKVINDTFGHARGDDLLRACAEVMRKSLRKADVLARVGGDEFAILLPQSDRETGGVIAERIRSCIAQYNWENPGLLLSVSLGVSTSEGEDSPLEETYRRADNIMYREKSHNKSTPRTVS